MKIYLVGGAIRDQLLGLPCKERDWVVVGASVDDMLKLGYRLVGKEFPVFLHPETREEYALARMERKVKPGYKGFVVDTSPRVTLNEDLKRRDLTINAMAETLEGELIDPYHGKKDLENRILRHVSPAFSEDPVRILRVGRFLARYANLGFHVAEETMLLMQEMVAKGEVDALVAERVWKELERALAEKDPEQFFFVLDKANALTILFPGLAMQSKGMAALKQASKKSPDPIIRFAALFHDLPHAEKAIPALANRYRLPNAYRELALLVAKHYREALELKGKPAEAILKLLTSLDIFRREKRFQHFVTVLTAIAEVYKEPFDAEWLLSAAKVAKAFDPKKLVAKGLVGNKLAIELKAKRLQSLREWLGSF